MGRAGPMYSKPAVRRVHEAVFRIFAREEGLGTRPGLRCILHSGERVRWRTMAGLLVVERIDLVGFGPSPPAAFIQPAANSLTALPRPMP